MSGKPWTEADDRMLRELAPHHSAADVGARIGRTKGSVIGRCHRVGVTLSYLPGPPRGGDRWPKERLTELLKLYYSPLGYSVQQMAAQLGISASAVENKLLRLRRQRRIEQRQGRRRPAVLRPPRPAVQNADDAIRQGIPLIDLKHNSCRWPIHGDNETARFCGDPAFMHLPYCEGHCARAYRAY